MALSPDSNQRPQKLEAKALATEPQDARVVSVTTSTSIEILVCNELINE